MPETIEDLNCRGYRFIQGDGCFRFGCDAVLLSGFAKVKKNEAALDLCCGTGIIPVLLSAKTLGRRFAGIEIHERSADTARRNAVLNGIADKMEIITGDVKDIRNLIDNASFDVVTANPPYIRAKDGVTNAGEHSSAARHEILLTLKDVISAAAWALKHGGRLYMVHKPERLVEIVNLLTEHKLEMKTLRFVQAYADRKPSMALIEAALCGRPQLTAMPPLVIYKTPGVYTDEVIKIYDGRPMGADL